MQTLTLSDDFFLSPVEWDDCEVLVEHLQDREISRNTLYIPYPYTTEDAEAWIEERIAHRRDQPAPVTFALRAPDGTLIGVVGADDLDVGASHRARIGYWLAKPYWGRGLMTAAVRRYVEYAFERLEVMRLTRRSSRGTTRPDGCWKKWASDRRATSASTARRRSA